jgi:hypothetical protein
MPVWNPLPPSCPTVLHAVFISITISITLHLFDYDCLPCQTICLTTQAHFPLYSSSSLIHEEHIEEVLSLIKNMFFNLVTQRATE